MLQFVLQTVHRQYNMDLPDHDPLNYCSSEGRYQTLQSQERDQIVAKTVSTCYSLLFKFELDRDYIREFVPRYCA